jgi:glycosyltransferase involved in cell wall biosynthesis
MSAPHYPKISVVTVNYNLGAYLEEAMRSVLDQNYPNLEYIVVDGGSTDGSVALIERYADHLAWWVSEPDLGQYHAVQKGFAQATGEIMYWLNSDDKLFPGALLAVAEIFQTYPQVRWLQGHPTEYTPEGSAIRRIALPWASWSRARYLGFDFQFIQQESTFWRRDLWEEAGSTMDLSLRLAGDMELWARFFRHAELVTTTALLGGFRHRRADQRSKDQRDVYLSECVAVIRRERARLPWLSRVGIDLRRVLSWPVFLFFFMEIPLLHRLYRGLMGIPQPISYDFYRMCYVRGPHAVRIPPLLWRGRQVARKR